MQERNDLGLQLIERNEEVCVFYERQNVNNGVLRKANMELSAREEELRFLRMEVRRGGEGSKILSYALWMSSEGYTKS